MLRGHVDAELIPILRENMGKLGLDYRCGISQTSIEKLENGMLKVNLTDGTSIETHVVLNATGRVPNLSPLKLENAGIIVENNAVKVDEYQNTNIPGIYAIGDVTNGPQLTPVAIRAGRIVSDRIFNGKTDLKMCYDNIATVIFSHPPIGCCGLTEEAAIAKYGADKVRAYRSKFINMYYSPALTMDKKQQSLFKVITHFEEDGTERVVGCFGIGKGVDEMIQLISIAVTAKLTKQDFDNSVAVHPTAAEEWVLMDANLI